MGQIEFKAFIVEEEERSFIREIKSKLVSGLPEGDLLIKVHYSSLIIKMHFRQAGIKVLLVNIRIHQGLMLLVQLSLRKPKNSKLRIR